VPSILVSGPYLVRSANISGPTLTLTGDLNSTTTIDVFAPSRISKLTWNGASVKVSKSSLGSLRGEVSLPTAITDASIPDLKGLDWVCEDSLPELKAYFDDSVASGEWVVANKTSTQRPQQPTAGKVSARRYCISPDESSTRSLCSILAS
jgi:hypothetical protein